MSKRVLHRLTAKGVRALGAGQHCDGGSLYLFKSTPHSGSWVFRYSGKNMGLGSMSVVSLAEARDRASACRKLCAAGLDPKNERRNAPSVSIEQHVARKGLAFLQQNIEPTCYLYRHYHPSGDLLYVGVSIVPLQRQHQHVRGAAWRDMICRIVIEPFKTREEALAAEEIAIRTEYPKFNSTHNKRRHPFQEMRRLAQI